MSQGWKPDNPIPAEPAPRKQHPPLHPLQVATYIVILVVLTYLAGHLVYLDYALYQVNEVVSEFQEQYPFSTGSWGDDF